MPISESARLHMQNILGEVAARDVWNHVDGLSTDAQPFAGAVTVAGTLTASGASVHTGTATFNGSVVFAGDVQANFTVASADGAITVKSGVVYVTKAGVCAMTIADPTATTDDGKILRVIATTASAHTLTYATTGFNAGGGGKDVGTFGGAKGDNIVITAYQGVWYVISNVNVTLG